MGRRLTSPGTREPSASASSPSWDLASCYLYPGCCPPQSQAISSSGASPPKVQVISGRVPTQPNSITIRAIQVRGRGGQSRLLYCYSYLPVVCASVSLDTTPYDERATAPWEGGCMSVSERSLTVRGCSVVWGEWVGRGEHTVLTLTLNIALGVGGRHRQWSLGRRLQSRRVRLAW